MAGSKKAWLPLVLVIALALAVSVGLFAKAAGLYNRTTVGAEQAAALQAAAAAVGLVVTIVLVGVTAWYAMLTRDILRQAGPRVSADLRIGWLPQTARAGIAVSGVFTAPFDSLVLGPPDQRVSLAAFAVTLRNGGNAATTVMSVSIAGNSGVSWLVLDFLVGTGCPFPLESHQSETRCVDLHGVFAAIEAYAEVIGNKSTKLRAAIELGSGDVVRSPWQNLPSAYVHSFPPAGD